MVDLSLFAGSFGFQNLPPGWSSFDKHTDSELADSGSYFPLFMFIAMGFFSSLGVVSVPWMLMSELFPFK